MNQVSRAAHTAIWQALRKLCCLCCLHLCLPLGADRDPKMQSHRKKVPLTPVQFSNMFEYPCARCRVRCWVIARKGGREKGPMDCSLPGSSVHGILQARTLQRMAVSFSRGSSPPRDQTQVSRIADRFFTV